MPVRQRSRRRRLMLAVGNHNGGGRPIIIEQLGLVKRIAPKVVFCSLSLVEIE
jgi:hypothetical protein